MKNDAVSMRPTETMTTASDGYHSAGTGLEIGFAACHTNHTKENPRRPRQYADLSRNSRSQAKKKRGGVGLLTIPPDLLVVACAGDPAAASMRSRSPPRRTDWLLARSMLEFHGP
jgi:hypothetical protein